FSVSGLPPGASASFKPASLSGSGSTSLTVTTNGLTPAGFYPLTVTGAGGGVSHSVSEILPVSSSGSLTPGNTWQSMAFMPQAGIFEARLQASLSNAAPSDGLVGISQGAANAESDLAVAVRFSSSGLIDATNGGDYTAVTTIPWTAPGDYGFRFF